MRVLVIGGGGREHAIIRALSRSPIVTELYALPGNGGIATLADCLEGAANDIDRIVEAAIEHSIDFCVVAPDDPLVLGAVDRLHAVGIRCFGPSGDAAVIEGSKIFAKELCRRHGIPTADYAAFDKMDDALQHLETVSYPIVIKADGLALGKGVIIAATPGEARNTILDMMQHRTFGYSGSRVVIEECLVGPEVSVLAFTDGKTLVPMVSSMDHKRAFDSDEGPNTGGMGAVAPNPFFTKDLSERCMRDIFLPTIQAMASEGRPFKGCLYFGLMLTGDGPKVIEFNCRFGDPETQVVLPLLETDLMEIMLAVEEERLHELKIAFRPGAACCVILASGGYPGAYQTGYPIAVSPSLGAHIDLFHAGTECAEGGFSTTGGRVLGVTAAADTLEQAIHEAYRAVGCVSFEQMHYRRDIGGRALAAVKALD